MAGKARLYFKHYSLITYRQYIKRRSCNELDAIPLVNGSCKKEDGIIIFET
jgi:hypothetical protein